MTVLHINKLLNAFEISSSEKLSNELVGSSRKIILGSFKKSFAIASLCF
jgi:hypothetical protein